MNSLLVGIDIGSTTTKIVALETGAAGSNVDGAANMRLIYSSYRRHYSDQLKSVINAINGMKEAVEDLPDFSLALTGSGSRQVAETLGVPFIQEVVANSVALKKYYPRVRTAIELGGQDAKMIFFHEGKDGEPVVSDMRMNGSCAGGTGAFIDEIASVLKVPVEQFNEMASRGGSVYDISGRCGVYAKTDIQPLLNQGVAREDLALSAFHAIAKQTIGGLAQGLDIVKPVAFEGGPLTFNPVLIRVFSERLELADDDIILPEHPQFMIAEGAALALQSGLCEGTGGEKISADEAVKLLSEAIGRRDAGSSLTGTPYFKSDEEKDAFLKRHRKPARRSYLSELEADRRKTKDESKNTADAGGTAGAHDGQDLRTLRAFLGIDSGSTTTKFVLLDESGKLIDSYYAFNNGDPLIVARDSLIDMRERYKKAGIRLEVISAGSTGYGELLFQKAFSTETHVIETVAHATAAAAYIRDASFILDIGGQDMKAIWLDHGVITNIVVNEACSSGCGSFLSNFATSLGIAVRDIAGAAFSSEHPAELGSRCTVFMNSSIVTEQRNGKKPADIMAGLCRSIIENVFTKVIRISNLDSLGDRIVVQGGTFENDAVLRAMEQFIGREVVRAPYPGIMGAIGTALITKRHWEAAGKAGAHESKAGFIGLDALDDFSYTQEANIPCPFCANHCKRTIVRFSNGESWVTNNRCERGEIVGDIRDAGVRAKLKEKQDRKKGENLFELRKKLLFKDYWTDKKADAGIRLRIGIPRVLAFWDNMPFWNTFLRSLGFEVVISDPNTRAMFESGLQAVTSDTVCFPAKLVHGAIRNLKDKKVDRIFMPSVTNLHTENSEKTSEWMCAVVKGYSYVLKNSDNPEKRWGIPFDTPLFHWFSDGDRDRQLTKYMKDTFGIDQDKVAHAIAAGKLAQSMMSSILKKRASVIIKEAERTGHYAVVLASRPYQNDDIVNHGLPDMIANMGISVLTADSLPGTEDIDLSNSRIDIVNNYHARMLSSAIMAAQNRSLEYIQIVSFGCGHDAYLSDEIIRVMHEISGKTPLILKMDESDVRGPLRIRLRSFIETVEMRREGLSRRVDHATVPSGGTESLFADEYGLDEYGNFGGISEPGEYGLADAVYDYEVTKNGLGSAASGNNRGGGMKEKRRSGLPDPYPVKFTKHDIKRRVVLIPNTSHAFSRVLAAAFAGQGIRTVSLDIGREEAIRLGKRYVHNDICFPAQIVIGEALAALKSGRFDGMEVAVGMGKYVGDCRLTHYSALLRKALDDAGFEDVPIMTNDDVDYHNMHPGFRMSLHSAVKVAYALPMIDIYEELLRKMRPYELEPGSADRAFELAMDELIGGMERDGVRGMKIGFKTGIDILKNVRYDRSKLRPRVLIVGEYLLNFHPGANHDIELYLEKNGMEIIEARMTDVIQKTYFVFDSQIKEFKITKPFKDKLWFAAADRIFDMAHETADRIASAHPLYERAARINELAMLSDDIIYHTFDCGEGILIPAEIIHNANKGCRAFVILQPFGCLPNHVVGRGVAKKLKELYPDVQILPLDYDPDVSFANIENRLQMLIMNAKEAASH